MSSHSIPKKIYVGIYLVLLLLLVATVFAGFLDWGVMNTVIALSIATAKAVLVILFFMHVRFSDKITWIYAGIGFYWLMLLLSFTVSDFAAQNIIANLPGF